MDVIALAQAGIEHAVAPLGTAITEAQLELLWKLAPEPVVALDGDPAGLAAAQRLIDLALPLLAPGRSLRFALMPPGQDPDDVVRAGGAAAMQALLDASRPIVDLLWTRETEGQVLDSPERRAALDARLRAHLARIADAGAARPLGGARSAPAAPRSSPRRRARADAGRRPRRRAARGGAPRPPRRAPPRSSPRPTAAPTREARIRESAILDGCLNHPAAGARLRGAAGAAGRSAAPTSAKFATPSCPRSPNRHMSRRRAIRSRPRCAPASARPARRARWPSGQVRANRHLGPGADPEMAAARHRRGADPPRRARRPRRGDARGEAELAGAADEALTGGCAPPPRPRTTPNTRPLAEDDDADEDAEHRDFVSFFAGLSRRSRPPETAKTLTPPIANHRFVRDRTPRPPGTPRRPDQDWSQPMAAKDTEPKKPEEPHRRLAARCST